MLLLKERIEILASEGLSPSQIADMIDRSPEHVRETLWRLRHPKEARTRQRRYDEARYGTPEYRKKDRARKRRERAAVKRQRKAA